MLLETPRLVVAGLGGDSGKTLVSLGLAGAFAARGLRVAPFKKGPDYIDAGWLGAATGRPGRNLDAFLMDPPALGEAVSRGLPAGLLLVEGNRGLYDGLDARGSSSTAELAKTLRAPVLLVVDATKKTRTVAAIVLGCASLDPEVNLAGVILNRVATPRQEKVIREALGEIGGPPVVAALPRLRGEDLLPGRHLGLVTAVEHPQRRQALDRAREAVGEHADLDLIYSLASSAPAVELPTAEAEEPGASFCVGVFRDEAFSFYYAENLEALEALGAEIVALSPLCEERLPKLDALYLGGGFPEEHAERLAANRPLRRAVRRAAEEGLPIYAECGGLMYLSRTLLARGQRHPMAGVLDLVVELRRRPQGHGYVVAEVDRDCPFFDRGTLLRGHEFHYSRAVDGADRGRSVLRLERGEGLGEGRDGIVKGRVWASYTHLHALGTPEWARGLASAARGRRAERAAEGRGEMPEPLRRERRSAGAGLGSPGGAAEALAARG
jgi:cobyrinic acid a,c-diamide synthase